jgi:tetratricopeptide (TPR) repeat protein
MLLFTQAIKTNRELAEALTRVLQHSEVQYGIFRITDGVTGGRIFIADGSVFVGAELAEGKMGAQAVYRLLSISDGIVGFLQVPFEPLDDSTFVDIRTLLFEFEQFPDIPLAEALTKIVGDSARDFDTPAAAIQPEGQSMAVLMGDAIHKQIQKELGKKAADTADGDKEKLLLEHLNYYNKLLSQLDRAPYASWLARAELLNSDLVVYECLLEGGERKSEVAETMNRLRETLKKAISRAAETASLLADVDTGYTSTSEVFKPPAAPQAPPEISHRVDEIAKPASSDKPAQPLDLLAASPSAAPPPVSAANRVDKIAVPASPNPAASQSSSGANASSSSTSSSAPPPVSAANRVDKIAMPASSAAAKANVAPVAKPPGNAPKPTSDAPEPVRATPGAAPESPSSETPRASLADAWQKALSEAPAARIAGDAQQTSELQRPDPEPQSMTSATEAYEALDDASFPEEILTAKPMIEDEQEADSAPLLIQLTSLAANTRETNKPSLVALGESVQADQSATVQTAAIKESDLLARRQSMQEAARAPNTVTTPSGNEPAKPSTPAQSAAAKPARSPSGVTAKPPAAPGITPSSPTPAKPAAAPPAPERKEPPARSLNSLLSFDDDEEEPNGSTDSYLSDSSVPQYNPGDESDDFDPDRTLADPVTAISDALFERYKSPKKQPSEAARIDTSKPVRASALEDDLFASYESPKTADAQKTAKDTFSKLEFKPNRQAAGSQPGGEALSQLQAKIGGGAAPGGKPADPPAKQPSQAPEGAGAMSIQPPMGPDDIMQLDAIPTPQPGAGAAAPTKPSIMELNAIPTPKTPPKIGGDIPIGSAGGPTSSSKAAGAEAPAKASAADTFAEGPSKLRGNFTSSTSGQVHKLGTTPGARGRTNEALVSALSQMFEGLEIDESELASIEEQSKRAEEEQKRFQQEISDAAKANDMLSQAALAGIRNQEAQVAEKELRTELSSLRNRQVSNKRYIIAGGVAAVVIGGAIVWALTHPGGPQITGELEAARKYMKDGYKEAARAEVKMAIAKDPNNAEAHMMYGEMLFDVSEWGEALKEFKQGESHGGKLNSTQLHQLAESAIRTKNWAEARATTKRQLKAASSRQLLVQLGRIERDSGNWQEALEPFNKAIAGGYHAAYRERGELYFKLKQPKKAMSDLDHAIKINDKDLHAHLLRGRAFLQMGDPKSALAEFAKAQLPEKPDSNVLAYQAVAYNRTGQAAKAVNAASKAIEIDRNSVPAYLARGEGYMAQRTYQRAVGDFDTVLQIDPNHAEAKSRRQAAYVAYKRSSGRSLHDGQTASIPVPSNLSADSMVLKGYEALRRGNTDEALAFLAAAVKKQPNDPMARIYLGHAFLKAGQPSQALQQFQAAQSMGGQMRPLDRAAWAEALLNSGRKDEAKEMFEQILQSSPKLFAARLGQLRTYIISGDRKRARQLAREYMVDSSEQEQDAFSSLFRSEQSSPPPSQDNNNNNNGGGGGGDTSG